MVGEWNTSELGELYEFGSGLSKARDQFGYGSPFLAFKDIFDNYFVPETLDQLVNSTSEEQQKYSVNRGDVFLTRTSENINELGMSCVALRSFKNATFNGFTKRLRPKSNQVVPEYAAYFFRSKFFRNQMFALSNMSTRASLNNEMLARLTISLPQRAEQVAIAAVLKYLDDKIVLNRRIAATLEEIARALFKSWFVDFDPVRAKSEGRPTGLPEATSSLFPDRFGDDGLPKGWGTAAFGGLFDVRSGNTPRTEDNSY